MQPLYGDGDHGRVTDAGKPEISEAYRSSWRRDYARLIHSPSFRRLQGKTQVFPGHEGDFFRNRLSHSLEVAQIAKSIAIRLNAVSEFFAAPDQKIEPDIVEFAGLAHDLGHPPFGHNGEEALDRCMRDYGGFEGNAQTLRIVSKLEKKATLRDATLGPTPFSETGVDERAGLNLSYRSLAALLKYDNIIPERAEDRVSEDVVKGYYAEDAALVRSIKEGVVGRQFTPFKTIECSVMDTADDIAYSTYDLEDVFKSGILGPLDLFVLEQPIYDAVVNTINKRLTRYYGIKYANVTNADIREILHYIFLDLFEFGAEQSSLLKNRKVTPEAKKMYFAGEAQQRSRLLAKNGYYRTALTSRLVQIFLGGVEVVPSEVHPALHQARLDVDTFIMVEVLKNITYEAVIRAPALQVVEFRGKDIIQHIYEAIMEKRGERLLPEDARLIYQRGNDLAKHRTVCDFIAGMTDRYAVEFYGRLFGAQGITMYRPL